MKLSGADRNGLVMDIATSLNALNAKVRSLNARDNDGTASVILTVEVKDLGELRTMINRLSTIRGISTVERSNA